MNNVPGNYSWAACARGMLLGRCGGLAQLLCVGAQLR
jgi:hypothetical protein